MTTYYNPYLFVIMRTDLESMSSGKMAAQACHGANACVKDIRDSGNKYMNDLLDVWEDSTPSGFGVTIILDGGPMVDIVDLAVSMSLRNSDRISSGIIHDPSYPISDGDVTHLIPLNTCMYMFYDKNEHNLLDRYPLHD